MFDFQTDRAKSVHAVNIHDRARVLARLNYLPQKDMILRLDANRSEP